MKPPGNTHRLDDLTWEEAQTALDTADYVVLPCGATEQHATHLPLSVDTIRATELAADMARDAANHDLELWVLPTLPYGYSEHHLSFAGTITLSQETYKQVVIEIGTSLNHHGVDRLLLFNAHLGNEAALQQAADRLQRDHDLPTHYISWGSQASDLLDEVFDGEWGHAGSHETSVIEHYEPDLVRTERKRPPKLKGRPETRGFRYIDEVTEYGNLSDPTISDPEAIEAVIQETHIRILESLRDDIENEKLG